MRQAFIGIDVGTSSARAGVFDENGVLLATARHPITVWHEAGSVVEQSSSEIWSACAASFRATGSTARSICTVVCKWNYLAHDQCWSRSYFERVGLGDLVFDKYAKIGTEIVAPGTPLGAGLTKSAAHDFGLLEGTPVAASLIDAHAGGVGTIGGRGKSGESVDVCRRLAYIMGTSACIMATTPKPCFVSGVW